MPAVNTDDTTPDAREKMDAVLRGKSARQRLAMLDAMWRSASRMTRQRVRQCHPEWDEPRVIIEAARRLSHGAF